MSAITRMLSVPVATALLTATAAPVPAAVRLCLDPLEGRPAEAHRELEARRLALADWTAEARRLGPGYTRWQLAWDRAITCSRTPAGAFRCQASGRPCTIRQIPLDPGTVEPLRRRS